MQTLYIGVDVSLAHLDVALATTDATCREVGRLANQPAGWEALVSRLSVLGYAAPEWVWHLLIEPTGGYEAGLQAFAYGQGWQVTVVNPLQVRHWASGQGVRAKTDRQDAQVLARYGASMQPAGQEPMDEGAGQLEELLQRRSDLEQMQQAERNRLAQAAHQPHTPPFVTESLQRSLRNLAQELDQLDEALEQLWQSHPYLQAQRQLLRSAPAIGEKLSLHVLVLCYRFAAYTARHGTGKQLVAYLGLDPQPYESGRSVRKRSAISRQGNAHLRAMLYWGALGGIRGHNPLRVWYQQLVARGKPKKVALVACSRKVLTWAWAIFTSNSPFDPTHHNFHQIPA
jgi:transposase